MSELGGTGESGPVLAFDTSSSLGSVVVAAEGRILARVFLESQRQHAAALLPAIRDILGEVGMELPELRGLVVGSGPGSFTGVRVAAATAKGLGHGTGLPVWAYSSLMAAAASLGARLPRAWPGPSGGPPARRLETLGPGAACYVLFDARGDRVYAGCYRIEPTAMEILIPPAATGIEDVLSSDVPPGSVFAGSGALRHAWAIEQEGWSVAAPPSGVPMAEGLVRVLELSPSRPVEELRSWEPEYLRAWSRETTARS